MKAWINKKDFEYLKTMQGEARTRGVKISSYKEFTDDSECEVYVVPCLDSDKKLGNTTVRDFMKILVENCNLDDLLFFVDSKGNRIEVTVKTIKHEEGLRALFG